MLNFFKKTKVENGKDLAETMVILAKSKAEKSVADCITELDERLVNEKSPYMCNGDERVKLGDQEMSVAELIEKYQSSMKPKNEDEADKDLKKDQVDESGIVQENENPLTHMPEGDLQQLPTPELPTVPVTVEQNADEDKDEEEEKKKLANAKKAAEKTEFEKLLNAHKSEVAQAASKIELSSDRVARGQARYGSN